MELPFHPKEKAIAPQADKDIVMSQSMPLTAANLALVGEPDSDEDEDMDIEGSGGEVVSLPRLHFSSTQLTYFQNMPVNNNTKRTEDTVRTIRSHS